MWKDGWGRASLRLAVRWVAALLLALWLAGSGVVRAQGVVTEIGRLALDFWPDYDRPAVLVLITAEFLPTGSPQTITLPLPEGSDVHVVARFGEDGQLYDDVPWSLNPSPRSVTLTTTASRVLLEYYAPYQVSGDQYSYRFEWQAPLNIAVFDLAVQQPVAATALSLQAPAEQVVRRNDGLLYHVAAPRSVAANQRVTHDFRYTMPVPALSAGSSGAAPIPSAPPVANDQNPFTWPMVTGVVAMVGAALLFAFYTWRGGTKAGGRVNRPKPVRPAGKGQSADVPARFCTRCGTGAAATDRFCRSCGGKL